MEVKELRDIIKEIHDSGDCGQALSEALEIANKICGQQSDLEIVQKALIKSNAGSIELSAQGCWTLIGFRGNHITTGGDCKSLLTWAKQTIGE